MFCFSKFYRFYRKHCYRILSGLHEKLLQSYSNHYCYSICGWFSFCFGQHFCVCGSGYRDFRCQLYFPFFCMFSFFALFFFLFWKISSVNMVWCSLVASIGCVVPFRWSSASIYLHLYKETNWLIHFIWIYYILV